MQNSNKYTHTTVNKNIVAIKAFFKFALNKEFITQNPAMKVKMKRTETQYSSPRGLREQELMNFVKAIGEEEDDSKRLKALAMCYLMLKAGLRVDEIVNVTVSNIQVRRKKRHVSIRSNKANFSRTIYLDGDTIEILKCWIDIRKPITANDALFICERGTSISSRSINYMLTYYAKKAGLEYFNLYGLRHTFAKNLVTQGLTVSEITYYLGRSDLEGTKRYLNPKR
ncbi:tyrosine-type recombinase/integrase [Anaerosolibacter sp.]|uniref:tyrosine-type recombinase/integrase n=1 Tax=Anaerosolibacter sp. TaxID=1872527 RepID=UPI0039EF3F12